MQWKFLLMVLLTCENLPTLQSEKSCSRHANPKRKRHAHPSYRYRPRLPQCRPTCDHHRHLLLVTSTSVYHHLLKECSHTIALSSLLELDRHLAQVPSNAAIVIVHTHHVPTSLHLELIDLMVSCLGNVSVWVDDYHRFFRLLMVCDRLDRCNNLFSLATVIEQAQRWRSSEPIGQPEEPIGRPIRQPIGQSSGQSIGQSSGQSNGQSTSSTQVDLHDPHPLVQTPGRVGQPSTEDLEMQLLAVPLCSRSRRFNIFYELNTAYAYDDVGKRTPNKEIREYRLELQDILPLDPKNYDKNRAPRTGDQPTLVDFHVTVLSLDSINEESMTYVADIFLAQSWQDQRLRLPESMGEYRILNVDWLQDIWKPDSFFKNAKQVTFHEISVPNHYLWLYHDKTLLYMSKLNLVLSCAMKFEAYPHDTQICGMMIESLSHTTDDLIFRWNVTDPLVVNSKIELPQLDISRNYTSDCTIEYSTGNFTCLAVMFCLRRRLGYHLLHTYIPSALIVVMSWISFWIKPEAIPARVTLGVTSLLTLATQNTQSQQLLPPVSYVKAIDIWMSSCSIFVFMSLMEFAIVNNYMGPVATKVMKGYSEDDVHIVEDIKGLQSRSSSPTRNVPTEPKYDTCCHGKVIAVGIDKFSRVFFPVSFLALNIIYWTVYL